MSHEYIQVGHVCFFPTSRARETESASSAPTRLTEMDCGPKCWLESYWSPPTNQPTNPSSQHIPTDSQLNQTLDSPARSAQLSSPGTLCVPGVYHKTPRQSALRLTALAGAIRLDWPGAGLLIQPARAREEGTERTQDVSARELGG